MLPFLVIPRTTPELSAFGPDATALTWKLNLTSGPPRRSFTLSRHEGTYRPHITPSFSAAFPVGYRLPADSHSLSRFFVALPYISSVSPLPTAFTHFDRGGRVRNLPTFGRSDLSTSRPFLFITLRLAHPQPLCFHNHLRCRGVRGKGSFEFNRVTGHHPQVTCFHGTAASLPSLCSKSHPRFLCFQQLTDSFCKYRGCPHVFHRANGPLSSLGGVKRIDPRRQADRGFASRAARRQLWPPQGCPGRYANLGILLKVDRICGQS